MTRGKNAPEHIGKDDAGREMLRPVRLGQAGEVQVGIPLTEDIFKCYPEIRRTLPGGDSREYRIISGQDKLKTFLTDGCQDAFILKVKERTQDRGRIWSLFQKPQNLLIQPTDSLKPELNEELAAKADLIASFGSPNFTKDIKDESSKSRFIAAESGKSLWATDLGKDNTLAVSPDLGLLREVGSFSNRAPRYRALGATNVGQLLEDKPTQAFLYGFRPGLYLPAQSGSAVRYAQNDRATCCGTVRMGHGKCGYVDGKMVPSANGARLKDGEMTGGVGKYRCPTATWWHLTYL